MSDDRVRPFSCGSQYEDWSSANCDRCKKRHDDLGFKCDIEAMLFDACMDHGDISKEMADRMGHTKAHAKWKEDGEYYPPYQWKCEEWEPTKEWKAEWRRIHGKD